MIKQLEQVSRSRAATELGWLGRKRNYKCRGCGAPFQVDTRDPLPVKDRLCFFCRVNPECLPECRFEFVDKSDPDGPVTIVEAHDAELATLRAWAINPNLTFKGR